MKLFKATTVPIPFFESRRHLSHIDYQSESHTGSQYSVAPEKEKERKRNSTRRSPPSCTLRQYCLMKMLNGYLRPPSCPCHGLSFHNRQSTSNKQQSMIKYQSCHHVVLVQLLMLLYYRMASYGLKKNVLLDFPVPSV